MAHLSSSYQPPVPCLVHLSLRRLQRKLAISLQKVSMPKSLRLHSAGCGSAWLNSVLTGTSSIFTGNGEALRLPSPCFSGACSGLLIQLCNDTLQHLMHTCQPLFMLISPRLVKCTVRAQSTTSTVTAAVWSWALSLPSCSKQQQQQEQESGTLIKP